MKVLEHEILWGARTYIMGILNVTPDSFSDGGDFISMEDAVSHAKIMIEQGADFIDIGGESSRPGHTRVTAAEELKRVIPVIERLARETKTIISIDTTRPEVAEAAIQNGAHIVNDIWGLQGEGNMAAIVAKHQVPVIIMHNQTGSVYVPDMMVEIKRFLKESIALALDAGVRKDRIILDPGIGFGKTPEQNMILMRNLDQIKALGYPTLLGASRKSMIGKILDLPPKERLEGTLATTVIGIMQGIDIVRVHDVRENLRAARVADALTRGESRWTGSY